MVMSWVNEDKVKNCFLVNKNLEDFPILLDTLFLLDTNNILVRIEVYKQKCCKGGITNGRRNDAEDFQR